MSTSKSKDPDKEYRIWFKLASGNVHQYSELHTLEFAQRTVADSEARCPAIEYRIVLDSEGNPFDDLDGQAQSHA